jgi:hypothetical protein
VYSLAVRRSLSVVVAAAAIVVLVHSVWIGMPHSWRLMRNEHARFSSVPAAQREQAFVTSLPLQTDIFEFYRHFLRPGDRYWMQVRNGAFGQFADKQTAVTAVAHLYLLPAIAVDSIDDANVILSWDMDPALLPLRYSEQHRASLQLVFVSRVRSGG